MNFCHVKLESLDFDLEAVTTENGRRYTTPDGKVYPSITTVLSSYNKKALLDRKSTRLNSSHIPLSRMPSSA